MKEEDLNKMKLPSRNENEELEDISRNFFRPLFDVTLFEIIQEIGRDKGIDFNIELKKGNSHTGIRFLVQLKSTNSIERNKTDGSISCPLETSNINSLLNSGLPSYYVFYYKPDNIFYYQSVFEILKQLVDEKENWGDQGSHSIRFTKVFDSDARKFVYMAVIKRGILLRTINEKLAIESSLLETGNNILVDQNFNVSSDEEVRSIIEKYGLQLINEARWNDVLDLHKKVSQTVASSALYNLTLGLAHYYSGDLLKSLSFLKSAINLKNQLSEALLNHLLFFDLIVRYALGLLSSAQYKEKLKSLEGKGHVGDYIRIDSAKERYLKSAEQDIDKRYELFFSEINAILEDPKVNEHVKLTARCESILVEGSKLNMDFLRSIPKIKIAEQMGINSVKTTEINDFLINKKKWTEKVTKIKSEAIESKNYLAFYSVIINEIKVLYEFIVYQQVLNAVDAQEAIDDLFVNLESALTFFRKISYIQNICVSLSIKYELLHYIDDLENAYIVLKELSDLVGTYELNESKIKVESLRNQGTAHEKLDKFFLDIRKKAGADDIELDQLVNEMREMDRKDAENRTSLKDSLVITLHPIGEFQFPNNKRASVYKILAMTENVQTIFNNMWDKYKVIPVANIYYQKIDQEGYREVGYDMNIEVWRNIYRVRKEFFNNKFRRVKLKLS